MKYGIENMTFEFSLFKVMFSCMENDKGLSKNTYRYLYSVNMVNDTDNVTVQTVTLTRFLTSSSTWSTTNKFIFIIYFILVICN